MKKKSIFSTFSPPGTLSDSNWCKYWQESHKRQGMLTITMIVVVAVDFEGRMLGLFECFSFCFVQI